MGALPSGTSSGWASHPLTTGSGAGVRSNAHSISFHGAGQEPVRFASAPAERGLDLEEFADRGRGARRAVSRDWPVVDLAADLFGDRRGDRLGGRAVEVHPYARAVAVQAVMDVNVLLEVVLEREVDKGRRLAVSSIAWIRG